MLGAKRGFCRLPPRCEPAAGNRAQRQECECLSACQHAEIQFQRHSVSELANKGTIGDTRYALLCYVIDVYIYIYIYIIYIYMPYANAMLCYAMPSSGML